LFHHIFVALIPGDLLKFTVWKSRRICWFSSTSAWTCAGLIEVKRHHQFVAMHHAAELRKTEGVSDAKMKTKAL